MHSKRIRIWAMTAIMALGGASHAQEQVTPLTLVKVDDFPVTNLHFALFASQTGRNPQDAPEQIALLNELVNNFMVANSAQGRTLAADPEVVAALEVARARLIAQAFVRTQMDSITIDEEQLREIYDSEYAAGEHHSLVVDDPPEVQCLVPGRGACSTEPQRHRGILVGVPGVVPVYTHARPRAAGLDDSGRDGVLLRGGIGLLPATPCSHQRDAESHGDSCACRQIWPHVMFPALSAPRTYFPVVRGESLW